MAILINAETGAETEVFPRDKRKGFQLAELYELIGNNCDMVELVTLADGRGMWLDEEGKFRRGLFANGKATDLLQQAGGIPGDVVMGNVLITSGKEVQ